MTTPDVLLGAIESDPTDDLARFALADWLEEQGRDDLAPGVRGLRVCYYSGAFWPLWDVYVGDKLLSFSFPTKKCAFADVAAHCRKAVADAKLSKQKAVPR